MSQVGLEYRFGHAQYKRAYKDGTICDSDREAHARYVRELRRLRAGQCLDCGVQLRTPGARRCQPCFWGWA